LVAHGELPDASDDASLELVAILDELLKPILVETDLFESFLSGVLDKPLVLFFLT